jgi:hypothetical protein
MEDQAIKSFNRLRDEKLLFDQKDHDIPQSNGNGKHDEDYSNDISKGGISMTFGA